MAGPEVGLGIALARVALAGNPSDGYHGAVLASTFRERFAQASARRSPQLEVTPASDLVHATVRRFLRELAPGAAPPAVEWETSIPRAVGLGGSSAIVIATLRALCELHGIVLEEAGLASLALAVEQQELDIAAGLQDRVAQAFGGVTFMNFARGAHRRYEQLDPRLLPTLLIAWRADAAGDSGAVHRSLQARFERGDHGLRAGMADLADLALRARTALLRGDRDRFARCVQGSFEARRRMMALDPRHVEMISIAGGCGASANYTGSGGAIVAVCRDPPHRAAVAAALRAGGCETVLPT